MPQSTINLGASQGRIIQQLGQMSNRHGLIAGATGTGKTVALQVLAEGLSKLGVPVFATGIKAAADSFRSNPAFDTQKVVTQLGTGEALVSVLDEKVALPR